MNRNTLSYTYFDIYEWLFRYHAKNRRDEFYIMFPVIQAIVNEFCDMNCLSQITIFNVFIRNSNP